MKVCSWKLKYAKSARIIINTDLLGSVDFVGYFRYNFNFRRASYKKV